MTSKLFPLMKRAPLLLALAVLAPAVLRAQAPAPAAPREVKITNRSTFEPDGPTKRAPFTPIGYVRATKEAPREVIMDVRAEMFTVSAILLGDPPLAIINGKDRGVGDRIPVGSDFVTVRRISDGQVTLDHRGRQFVVIAGRRR